VRAAYRLLGLITFFTAVGGTEIRARSLPEGSTAHEAAGRVHTDMQRGFVRAEVVGWEDLLSKALPSDEGEEWPLPMPKGPAQDDVFRLPERPKRPNPFGDD